MKPYLFVDLDDTLFQTIRKCPPSDQLKDAALGRNGSVLSFMSSNQQTLFNVLCAAMRLIPTTARSYDAFKRVLLPFHEGAILDYGGVILDRAGQVDPQWDAVIRSQAQKSASDLEELCRSIQEFATRTAPELSVRIISDFGIDMYIVIKHPQAHHQTLNRLHEECVLHVTPPGFYVHFNDNNIAIIPDFLNKAHAVRFYIENKIHPGGSPYMTLGMGDSFSDLSFMKLCDYLIVPGTSQIARNLS